MVVDRSIIRLSHLKHSQVMRNISPSVRMPARLGRQAQAKEAIRVAQFLETSEIPWD
jgi:hypothetical protein